MTDQTTLLLSRYSAGEIGDVEFLREMRQAGYSLLTATQILVKLKAERATAARNMNPVIKDKPRFAARDGCWRHGVFLEFAIRGQGGARFDIWNERTGRSFLIDFDQVNGETEMQRAMAVRRQIDAEIKRWSRS